MFGAVAMFLKRATTVSTRVETLLAKRVASAGCSLLGEINPKWEWIGNETQTQDWSHLQSCLCIHVIALPVPSTLTAVPLADGTNGQSNEKRRGSIGMEMKRRGGRRRCDFDSIHPIAVPLVPFIRRARSHCCMRHDDGADAPLPAHSERRADGAW